MNSKRHPRPESLLFAGAQGWFNIRNTRHSQYERRHEVFEQRRIVCFYLDAIVKEIVWENLCVEALGLPKPSLFARAASSLRRVLHQPYE